MAAAQLATLAVKGRAPMTGYSRDQFGPAWPTTQGCDARNRALRRDLTNVAPSGTCTVQTGTLISPYSATTINFVRGPNSAIVQIDHVVPLGDAWQKGAQQWTASQRETFANDPLELLAVDAHSNEQKGDGDAATWLPANKPFRCAYAAIQVNVKATYRLWVTQAEHDAIASILAGCGATPPASPTTVPPKATTATIVATPTKAAPPTTTAVQACAASVSNPSPRHNQTVDVIVQTAAGAQLTVTAHYKSKDTVHAGAADGAGHADVPFDIATASYGFTVDVDIEASASGRTFTCSTSFTPAA